MGFPFTSGRPISRSRLRPSFKDFLYFSRLGEQENAELTAKLQWYEEQFRLAQQKRFGTSSEKTHPDQLEMNLFNEAEVLATPASEEPQTETITYSRKKWTDSHEAKLE
ncbi:hypothetical protein BK147_30965 [Paenibacillus sp. FSL R7-0337]|uniref:IS66 family transposase n=1 Tax=Paenibacillus sp. FSL R7-0337 TaxID=1926588 RepID=UPI00096D2CD8|nr:hypothetical protein [Paenibacillus sp. FSL R7-0337]OMF86083.1 hypothetical protein BK147_30965 [Paenibacillus sp. FSL R7-0337]